MCIFSAPEGDGPEIFWFSPFSLIVLPIMAHAPNGSFSNRSVNLQASIGCFEKRKRRRICSGGEIGPGAKNLRVVEEAMPSEYGAV